MVLESWKPKNRPLVRGPLIVGARGSVGGTEYRGAARSVLTYLTAVVFLRLYHCSPF